MAIQAHPLSPGLNNAVKLCENPNSNFGLLIQYHEGNCLHEKTKIRIGYAMFWRAMDLSNPYPL